eukprot:1148766-Pelagomonas_calceolata.AAC.17
MTGSFQHAGWKSAEASSRRAVPAEVPTRELSMGLHHYNKRAFFSSPLPGDEAVRSALLPFNARQRSPEQSPTCLLVVNMKESISDEALDNATYGPGKQLRFKLAQPASNGSFLDAEVPATAQIAESCSFISFAARSLPLNNPEGNQANTISGQAGKRNSAPTIPTFF